MRRSPKGPSSTSWRGGRHIIKATGYVAAYAPEHPRATSGRVFEHILVAERALGHYLAEHNQVHHIDEDRSNNAPANLVICESNEYHHLLHRRARALAACGHADWRPCLYCHAYDAPQNMTARKKDGSMYHRICNNEASYERKRRLARIAREQEEYFARIEIENCQRVIDALHAGAR